MSKSKKIIILTTLSLILEGCGVYKGSFDCKPGKGVGCESVSKVNDLVNKEKLDDFIEEESGSKGRRVRNNCKLCPKITEKTGGVIERRGKKNESIKIYFNKYRDANGILHKPSEVEVEVK